MSYWRDKGLQQVRALEARPSDWSPTQIAAIRPMAAQHKGAPEIIADLSLHISLGGFRARCKRLGISLHANSKQHYSQSTTLPGSGRGISTVSFRARSLP